MKPIILIIDDDDDFIDEISFLLDSDYEITKANNSKEAMEIIKKNKPDLLLLDLMLGDENGLDLLKEIKNSVSDLPVIMITEYASIDTAVEAMKIGAKNYVSKSPNIDELKLIIQRTLEQESEKLRLRLLEEEFYKPYSRIVGKSKAIEEVRLKTELFAKNKDTTILIVGESGSGKELVARQIHKLSQRKDKSFVAVNCAAIPENLIESELFGHEKGAFTGAYQRKKGKFEIASGGTIFLDEIAELHPDAQVKLMRVLQDKEFERVGGNSVIKTDARVIAATNRDLKKLVKEGRFREDLFYRLEVLLIEIPPLRERKEDISELFDYLLKLVSFGMNVKPPEYDSEVIPLLKNYNWPGNVREMINLLTRTIILGRGGKITPSLIELTSPHIRKETFDLNISSLKWEELKKLRREASMKAAQKVEAEFVKKLLEKFDGNVSKAAEYAGVHRTNLHKIINRALNK
jgi:DNA-binding NtrC family response regulator